jgi:hypothetical protein
MRITRFNHRRGAIEADRAKANASRGDSQLFEGLVFMSRRLVSRGRGLVVYAAQAVAVLCLLSASVGHAQFSATACMPDNTLLIQDQGAVTLTPDVWAPGHTYTVTINGTYPISDDCVLTEVSVSAWQWPGYPNYYDTGAGATFITLSNLTWVSSTVTTFNVSVASDAPTGPIFLALRSTFGWDFWGVSIQPPAPPAPPAPPPHVCQTPAFAPSSPVTPDTWIPGKTYQVTVKGTGFTTPADATETCPATQITISVDTGSVDLSNVVVVDSTTISAKITPAETDPGEMAEVQLWGPQSGGDDVVRANTTRVANAAPMTASNISIPGMILDALAHVPITPVVVQVQNVTPGLNLPVEKAKANSSATLKAHLTLGGTFQIKLLIQQADGTFQPIPSEFAPGDNPSFDETLDPKPLFPGTTVLQYTSQVDNAAVLQAVHLGTQQLSIKPRDTRISPVNITLLIENPSKLGPLHPEFDPLLYRLADVTGVPPQMIKGQIGNESGFNKYAWRYEPFNTTVGDFGYSTKPHNYRTDSHYGGPSFRLPTIGDSANRGNCVISAAMGNVKVMANGVLSNSVLYLNPSSAISGSPVRIVGTNFGSSQSAVSGAVTVNGVDAAITDWSDQSITVVVPNYDYATHVDSRIPDTQNCGGLPQGATFSKNVMEHLVMWGGGQNLMIPDRDPKTGAVLSLRPLKPEDRYVSVYDLFHNNPKSANSWVMSAGGLNDPRVQSIQKRAVDFTAQLTLAASYGLIQVTYAHAIDAGWTGNDDTTCAPTRMDPDNLFDTDCNLAHHGGSLGVGARSSEKHFASSSENDESHFELDFAAAFQFYNHNFTGYGNNVVTNARSYEPNPTGTIFSTGGGQ